MSLTKCLPKTRKNLDESDVQAINDIVETKVDGGIDPVQAEIDAVNEYAGSLDHQIDEIAEIAGENGIEVNRGEAVKMPGDGETLFQEETAPDDINDLFVVHNLSQENLQHSKNLGAIPVPSLAIASGKHGFTGFGEISLVGNKELIDPRASRKNKVFSGDAYSPRYPAVRYKITSKNWERLVENMSEGVEVFGRTDLDGVESDLEYRGARKLGETSTAMYQYLHEKGKPPRKIYEKRSNEDKRLIAYAKKFVGKGTYFDKQSLAGQPEFQALVLEVQKENIQELRRQDKADKADRLERNLPESGSQTLRDYAWRVAKNIESSIGPRKIDDYAMLAALRKKLARNDDYKQWVEAEFQKVVSSEKVVQRNQDTGAEKFFDHNLDNVVRLMTKTVRGGEGVSFGAGSVRAFANKQFSSVKEIQESRDKIVDRNAMDAVQDEVNQGLIDVSDKVMPPQFDQSSFQWLDTFTEHLKEMIQYGPRAVKRDYGYSDSDIELMQEFMEKLVNVPTEYFEAKIQRAVDFREFEAAIVPTGTDKKTIEYLKSQGLQIKRYKKGDKDMRLDAIKKSKIKFFQDKKKNKKRGSIEFNGPSGQSVIRLFEGKDLSTALHEFGHFFLETKKVLYNSVDNVNDLPLEFVDDVDTITKWLGVESLDDIQTEQHEQFARGFESYLREGKAPSVELRDVFRRFKNWLTSIYKTALNLNVKVSPEMAGVFDRILATSEQIDALSQEPGLKLDPEMAVLLTKAEREDYAKRLQNELDAAKERLMKKTYKEKLREKKQWYKDELEVMEKVVEKKVNKKPAYQALHYLRTGEFLDSDAPKEDIPPKLDKALMDERYDENIVRSLPQDIMSDNGVDPDEVAELFGYEDAGQMANEIAGLPDRERLIRKYARQAMRDKYGDILSDGTIDEEAIEAVEVKEKAARIEYELNILSRQTGEPLVSKGAFKDRAKQIINDKKVDTAIQANTYYRQEVKAAREAGKALGKKDYIKATEWKKKQLLNHHLYRESKALRVEAEKAIKLFKKISKRPAKGKVVIDEDYRQKALTLLEDFNFGPRLSGEKRERLTAKALTEWKERKEIDDSASFIEDVEITAALTKQHYRDLTVGEFMAVTDTVKNIIAQGKLNRFIKVGDQKIVLKEASETIAKTVEENVKKKPEYYFDKFDWRHKYSRGISEIFMSLTKTRTLIREMDGLKDLGKVYKLLMSPIDKAENTLVENQRKIGEKLDELFKKHFGKKTGDIRNKKFFIKSLGQSFRKEEIIAVGLNWGNEGNRDRITTGIQRGKQWNEQVVTELLSNLTEKEWLFIQDTLNYIDSFWGQIEALEIERTGIAPIKVESSPFTVVSSDGVVMNLNGGYYPLAYDHSQASQVADPSKKDLVETMKMGAFASVHTQRGFTEARGRNMGWPVNLSLDVIGRHLNLVAVDLALSQPTNNFWRLINNAGVSKALDSTMGTEASKHLKLWAQDLASYSSYSGAGFEGVLNSLRSGLTVSTMGFKMSTTLLQMGGFAHSFVKLGPKYMAKGISKAFSGLRFSARRGLIVNKRFEEVYAKSKLMESRSTTFHRDIYDAIRGLEKSGKITSAIAKAAFWPIVKMQMMVDVPTWLGAYEQGWDKFSNEKDAIEFADMVVIQAQSSGLMKDLASIERGTLSESTRLNVLVKMFTVFMSYFNAKLQLAKESTTRVKSVRDVPRFASDFLMLFIVEAVLTDMLLGRMPDFEEDDDKDPVSWAFKLGLQNAAGTIPLLREVSSGLQGFDAAPGGYRGLDIIAEGIGSTVKAGEAFIDDEEINTWRTSRSIISAAGILVKAPGAQQFNVFLKASERNAEGEDVPFIDYLISPPRQK